MRPGPQVSRHQPESPTGRDLLLVQSSGLRANALSQGLYGLALPPRVWLLNSRWLRA